MYITSNDNRIYAAREESYGRTPAVTAAGRIPAVALGVQQRKEMPRRRDKTGTRSFLGVPAGTRSRTHFALETYLTGWNDTASKPVHDALFRSAFGGEVKVFGGASLAGASSPTRLQFAAAHGLNSGQAISCGGELRFVTALPDATTIDINAPFSEAPSPGSPLGPTVTYTLGKTLPSFSIFDYWQEGAVHRLLCGAAADKFQVKVNGDYHLFEFQGPAKDVVDSASFADGQAGLLQYPVEPSTDEFDYTIVPGHLGQVWIGVSPTRLYTVTEAELKLDNGLELRTREFGLDGPQAVVPGDRKVFFDFEMFAADGDEAAALYKAARQRSPVRAMVQLGQQQGQLFGFYVKGLLPEVPEYKDDETRLKWSFGACRAAGTAEDELVVAFG